MTSAAAWDEIVVREWHEFSAALEEVLGGYRVPPTYVFRGQANAKWLLEPSLLRQIRHVPDRAAARKIEQLLEEEFMAQAALFPETKSVLPVLIHAGRTTWWAYMQHHSCPTRLLDWTSSAFVAAYFAVNQRPESDGALFVVGAEALNKYNNMTITDELLLDPNAPDLVTFTWPSLRSSRIVAQQGHFSVSTNPLAPHDQSILEACSAVAADHPSGIIQRKIIIASCLKLTILQQLRAMNVAPHALFPDLDGLGRSLADLASLQAILSRPPREPE